MRTQQNRNKPRVMTANDGLRAREAMVRTRSGDLSLGQERTVFVELKDDSFHDVVVKAAAITASRSKRARFEVQCIVRALEIRGHRRVKQFVASRLPGSL